MRLCLRYVKVWTGIGSNSSLKEESQAKLPLMAMGVIRNEKYGDNRVPYVGLYRGRNFRH